MTHTNPWFLGAVALGCLAFGTPVFADLSVGNYALQNVTRVSRYEFDYRYTATVTNTGGETAKGVTARVSSVNPSLVIIDGEVTFGDVAGGATATSSDTFTVRHDRRQRFAKGDLQWSVVLSWSPSSLSQMLSAGQSVTITATFTAPENAQSVTVRVAPEIAPYVTVSPSSFANIIRGASYPVAVTFAAAADALTGLYDGVIDLQQGGGTLGQPLMVEVAIDGVPTVVHDPEGGIYSVNEIQLSLVDGATLDDAQRLAELVHGKILESFPDTNTYFLLVPTRSILELQNTIRLLEADPKVKFATTNELMNLYGITTDLQHLREQNPSSSYTEAYDQIAVEKAWELANDAGILPKKIDIGIADTGIDASHPEFDGVQRFGVSTDPGSTSPSSEGCPGSSLSSHGTQVAGIIGANNLSKNLSLPPNSPHMNGIIAGLPGAQYSIQVYSSQGFSRLGFYRDLRSAINDALENGAKIINISMGGISCGSPLGPNICGGCYEEKGFSYRKTDWEEIFDKYPGVLFVAAAGNAKVPAIFNLPGGGVSRPNLISVAATTTNKDNKDDKGHPTYPWMEYSNGWKNDAKTNNDKEGIDIAAPGEHVYAPSIYTAPLDYQDYDAGFRNTSAAAPIVTGVAAMMMAVSENALTSSEIKDILWATADPPCKPGERAGCLINPFAAVAYAITGGPPSTKFSIDDGVEISPDANMNPPIWNEPNGTVIDTQVPGARGTVVGGPRYSSTKVWLWRVDFESGADGWVVEEYLRKVDANYTDLTSQSLAVNGTLANGSTVTFTGVVKNSGTVPITTAFTDNFTYRWGTSGAWIQIGEHIPKTVPFAAGATQTDTSANFTFSSFGSFQAQHCIDSQGQLAESDETNNCTVQTYTVRGGAR